MYMIMSVNMNMNMDVDTYRHWSIIILFAKRFAGINLLSNSGGIAALLCLHNQK